MWYPTITETQQTRSPVEAKAERQSDSDTPADGTATAADLKKASAAATPGTEYWLP
jgi:hypothetical protein